MDEKEKIERIMQDLDLNSAQFAAEIGIQGSTLSHILNGRNKPSLDVLKKILNRFQNINPEWLILGNDSMYRLEKHSHAPTLFDSVDERDSESDIYISKRHQKTESAIEPIQKRNVNLVEPSTLEQVVKSDLIKTSLADLNSKSVVKIILYYNDNSFQEFYP